MKKKLGLGSIVLLAINSIIGSGIFLSPGSVIAMLGTKAPMAWLLFLPLFWQSLLLLRQNM